MTDIPPGSKATPRAVTSDGIPVFCAHDALVDPAELKEWPGNPNRHPPAQIADLRSIIEANGWREAITVSRRSGCVTKGHGRRKAALSGDPWKQVPVQYQDYADEDAERADVVADNEIAKRSKQEADALREFLKDVDFETAKPASFGLTEKELTQILTAPAGDDDLAQGEEDEAPNDAAVFIVPLAVSRKTYRAWQAKKASLGVRKDRDAFEKLIL